MAVACGRTAARFWELPLIDDDDPATGAAEHVHDDVTGWAHLRDQEYGDRFLHRRRLTTSTDDVVLTRSGLWVTSLQRTSSTAPGCSPSRRRSAPSTMPSTARSSPWLSWMRQSPPGPAHPELGR